MGEGVQGAGSDHSRARRLSGLIVAAAAVWLTVVLVGAAEQGMAGAAWVRVPLFVVLLALATTSAVLFVRSPLPADAPRPAEVRGGYGIDGPEQRRVRRALRDGAPLRSGDRDRALAQARRSLSKTTTSRAVSARDRYLTVVLGYVYITWPLGSSSLTAPTFESSDLRMLAVVVIIAAAGWLPDHVTIPGRQWRERRLRRRIDVLENHPVDE